MKKMSTRKKIKDIAKGVFEEFDKTYKELAE